MAAIIELKTLLSEDIRQLETLADLLNQEKQLLASSDIAPLEVITTQ